MPLGRSRILDTVYLVASALLVCVVSVGAFVFTETRHLNPAWVFLALLSIGFLVFAAEEYRSELRSARFIAFVCGWLFINSVVVVGVLSLWGWLYLIPALLLEEWLFYMTAYWIFGLQVPSRNRGRGAPTA
jgi:hypothetical protein